MARIGLKQNSNCRFCGAEEESQAHLTEIEAKYTRFLEFIEDGATDQ